MLRLTTIGYKQVAILSLISLCSIQKLNALITPYHPFQRSSIQNIATLSFRRNHHHRTHQQHQQQHALSSSSSSSTCMSMLPSLIVFDLDNTLWEPELYKLRTLERAKIQPIAGKDVTLFPAIKAIIQSIQSSQSQSASSLYANTKFAIASRTKSVEWAKDLLKQFELDDFFDYVEIFPGDKKTHFQNLREKSGIPFQEMLFFDDNRDGRFGNCVPVSQMGVLSVHCPAGINTQDVWSNGLARYEEWSSHKTPNTIIEWDGSMTIASQSQQQQSQSPNTQIFEGVVKNVNHDKRYGFISYANAKKGRDMFFHFSNLPANYTYVSKGDKLSFKISHDTRKGKDAATDIIVLSSSSSSSSNNQSQQNDDSQNTVNIRAFSMNLPFAALLANQYKTLETRNGTMFTPYPEGTKMLLHVGKRIYPDANRHIDVMKSGGLSDTEITQLKSLPQGYGKGMAVAIVEIGKTYETTLEERCDPDFQRCVGAFGEDSGMRATEIKRVAYLKRGVRVSGRGGVFKCDIDKDAIPDGWDL